MKLDFDKYSQAKIKGTFKNALPCIKLATSIEIYNVKMVSYEFLGTAIEEIVSVSNEVQGKKVKITLDLQELKYTRGRSYLMNPQAR